MRKASAILAAVLVLCVTVIVTLSALTSGRRQTIAKRDPLTLEELSRMAATWEQNKTDVQEAQNDASTDNLSGEESAPASEDRAVDKSEDEAPGTGPPNGSMAHADDESETPHLKRCLTREELTNLREERTKLREGNETMPRWQIKLVFVFFENRATLSSFAGSEWAPYRYIETAQTAEMLHDWETAASYFREVLASSPSGFPRKWCCSRLAWLEDDPVVAERLLELSCATDDISCLDQAVRFADATGSEALRDHYIARLTAVDSEWAKLVLEGLDSRRRRSP